jgi:hypothetical protein
MAWLPHGVVVADVERLNRERTDFALRLGLTTAD